MSDRPPCSLCGDESIVTLGIRARFPDTLAAWAPNIGVHLCGRCAIGGVHVALKIAPTDTGEVCVDSYGPDDQLLARSIHPINPFPL